MTGTEITQLYRGVLLRAWPGAVLLAILNAVFLDRLVAALPDPLAPAALERFAALLGSAGLWRGVLALALLSLWPTCALVLCALRIARGEPVPALGALPQTLRVYPAALFLSVVFAALTAVGLMLFIVPGIYLAGALQLWVVALLAGDAGASRSLQASWRLVQGRWWHSNTTVAIVVLCGLGIGALVSIAGSMVVQVTSAVLHLGAAPLRVVGLALAVAAGFVSAPAYPVALVASYQDLAKRR
jgi:hypothetical protein